MRRCSFAAIDRSVSSGLSDARDALVNAVVDLVSAYRSSVSNLQQAGLVLPASMCLFPVYILALLKQVCYFTHTHSRKQPQMDTRWLKGLQATLGPGNNSISG